MTENLQKEQLSRAYLRTIASLAGFSLSLPEVDQDSVDIQVMSAADFHPTAPRLDMQLKASTDLTVIRSDTIRWRLSRKNYDELRRATLVPRVLVVMLLPTDTDQWFAQSHDELSLRSAAYWLSLRGMPFIDQATMTVSVPMSQLLTPQALQRLMIDSLWSPEP